MRLAVFQMQARAGDVAANMALIAEAAAAARADGAELLVAPELATTGYGAGDAIRGLAEPADGPQVSALAGIAARTGLALAAGFPERAGAAIFNAAALVTPDGRRSVYRKCHLYGDYERAIFAPGDAAPGLFDVGKLRAGLLICYDVEFPEAVRRLALAGAELVLAPTAQSTSPDAAFITGRIVPVRAFENGIAIAYANHAGTDPLFTYCGHSCIVTPDGADAARAPAAGSRVIAADYDPAAYAEWRSRNPYLKDRRADLF